MTAVRAAVPVSAKDSPLPSASTSTAEPICTSSWPASPSHARPAAAITPQAIGRAATLALYDELALSPKPGLVTLVDRGSHADMDAQTFMRSLLALRGYFARIAALGAEGAPFAALQRCGIQAEARMLAATRGVNTHRGAIFMLGLLCAAAGAAVADGRAPQAAVVRATLQARWGAALRERARQPSTLPGGIAARRLGLRGAAAEAAAGFPVLFDTAWPAMRRASARTPDPRLARLDTLFHVMAVLDDSNLAHRGGLEGLRHAQRTARRFLAEGGATRPDAIEAAHRIGSDFVRRNLSPGGAADVLSATCWLARVQALAEGASVQVRGLVPALPARAAPRPPGGARPAARPGGLRSLPQRPFTP